MAKQTQKQAAQKATTKQTQKQQAQKQAPKMSREDVIKAGKALGLFEHNKYYKRYELKVDSNEFLEL